MTLARSSRMYRRRESLSKPNDQTLEKKTVILDGEVRGW